MDARPLRRDGRDAEPRVGHRHDPRRSFRLGGALRTVRLEVARRSPGARGPLCPRGLSGRAGDGGELGRPGEPRAARERLCRKLPPRWQGAGAGRGLPPSGRRRCARPHRREQRLGVLPRRHRRGDRRAVAGRRRCAYHGGLRRPPRRVGRPARGGRLRPHGPPDPAQRAGDRGPHRARHHGPARPWG